MASSLVLAEEAGSMSITERNEEINRRRFSRRGGPHVPKIIDPEAFKRFLEEGAAEAARERAKEDARETERKRREGSNYRTPEQRKKDAEAAAAALEASGEAKRIVDKFDPDIDYYKLLQLDRACSTEEVRRAFRKHALAYHPDKAPSHASEEQVAFMREQFQRLLIAHDVLVDDALRAIYDKTRDHIERHGPGTRPSLSPEEARVMGRGAGEMARIRRQKAKTVKPPAITAEVLLSLEELNDGVTATVEKIRHQVDASGAPFEERKQFHLIVRRGAVDGQCLDFENEGNEFVDTLPGDASFTIRSRPHAYFKRRGVKDLEVRLTAFPCAGYGECATGDVYAVRDALVLSKSSAYVASGGDHREFVDGGSNGGAKCARRIVFGVLESSLRRGGMGGAMELGVLGEGMPDPANHSLRGALWAVLRVNPREVNELIVAPCVCDALVGDSAVGSRAIDDDEEAQAALVANPDNGIAGAMAGGVLGEAVVARARERAVASDACGCERPVSPSGAVVVFGDAPISAAARGAADAVPGVRWTVVRCGGPLLDEEAIAVAGAEAVVVDSSGCDGSAVDEELWARIRSCARRGALVLVGEAGGALCEDVVGVMMWRG